ncbi:MAG: pyridoxamine 5'-phosphate oxidase family protein [Nitrososphaeria archaeon]|nr:pyridoxamine 5'-phosphate oxidase family protein [Nitrososphaeria archaeon]NIQ33409.1 pyridoxamine 5'-phosphate oxidase family protein [Nitrososphaeria archaeon]
MLSNTKKKIKELLNKQTLAVLATIGVEGPHTSLVAFSATEDLKQIVFSTGKATRKSTNLKRNPQVAVLIDDRTNKVRDFRDASVVIARGLAYEVGKKGKLLDLYLQKHPHLVDFVDKPSRALFSVKVKKFDLVTRFQHVLEMELDE